MWQIPRSCRASPLFRNICKQVLAKHANRSITPQQREIAPRTPSPPGTPQQPQYRKSHLSYQACVGFFFSPLEREERLQLIKLENTTEVCTERGIC